MRFCAQDIHWPFRSSRSYFITTERMALSFDPPKHGSSMPRGLGTQPRVKERFLGSAKIGDIPPGILHQKHLWCGASHESRGRPSVAHCGHVGRKIG